MQSIDGMIPVLSIFYFVITFTLIYCYYKFTRNFTKHFKMLITSRNFTNYAGIMLDALPSYYAQNYAGIIGSSLLQLKSLCFQFGDIRVLASTKTCPELVHHFPIFLITIRLEPIMPA